MRLWRNTWWLSGASAPKQNIHDAALAASTACAAKRRPPRSAGTLACGANENPACHAGQTRWLDAAEGSCRRCSVCRPTDRTFLRQCIGCMLSNWDHLSLAMFESSPHALQGRNITVARASKQHERQHGKAAAQPDRHKQAESAVPAGDQDSALILEQKSCASQRVLWCSISVSGNDESEKPSRVDGCHTSMDSAGCSSERFETRYLSCRSSGRSTRHHTAPARAMCCPVNDGP